MADAATELERRGDGFLICRLARPARGNGLSPEMVEGILDALNEACARPDIHTFVLRGAGRNFCTGFDLSALDAENDASLLARFVGIEMLLDAVWRAPLRTVAVAQGWVVGAGADLFAACDRRLLMAGGNLRFPGAGFGVVLGTRRLGVRVGAARALQFVTEGTQVGAAQAVVDGLATAIIEAPADPATGALDEEALLAAALSTLSPLSMEPKTFAALRAALIGGGADADLSALVRSAAGPGLKARIEAYVARNAKARARPR